MRDGEWYYKAYKFLEQFDGLELHWGMWLDGVYERYCIKDTKTGEWLGPEVEQLMTKNTFRIDDRRLMEDFIEKMNDDIKISFKPFYVYTC